MAVTVFINVQMFALLLIINLVSSQQLTGDELQSIFGSKKCIQATLDNIRFAEVSTFIVKDVKSDYQNIMRNATKLEDQKQIDKSILSKLNEFAQYNDLEYYFKLEKEEGPSHDRIFTVSLNIGEEIYEAEGRSLKKAQQKAATVLFEKTNYSHVPYKEKSEKIDESLTPTVLLNNICSQMGIFVEYNVVDKEHDILKSNIIMTDKTKKSYLQKLNDSLQSNKNIHVKKDLPNTKGPFTVKLKVGEMIFYGAGNSIQAAKHDAASNAIDYLIENKGSLGKDCLEEGSEEQCKAKKNSIKSPVSLAHEAAQIRGLSLDCQIVDESGPAHKKTFTTECQIGDVVTTGEGRSKKESKKAAAINLLERIDELPNVSKEKQLQSLVSTKSKKKKKKNKLIKSKFAEISLLAQQTISATLGLGKTGDSNDITETKKSKSSKKSSKPKSQNRSLQNEIINLSDVLGFSVDYSDFKNDGKHFSLLSLHFNPEHLCLGQSLTEKDARDKAALGALELIYNLNFKTHFDDKSTIEGEIKASVRAVLQGDLSKETDI